MKDKSGRNNPFYKHGETRTRLFRIWSHMRGRCNCPSDKRYADYGGRGIKITKEWDEYLAFKEWAMANGYKDNLTIDRIDNNGNYCPENCRWATRKEQNSNRRSNRYLTVDGITKTEKEWSDFLGIPSYVLRTRLHRGFSEEIAIKTPVRTKIDGKYCFIDYYQRAVDRMEAETRQVDIYDLLGEG